MLRTKPRFTDHRPTDLATTDLPLSQRQLTRAAAPVRLNFLLIQPRRRGTEPEQALPHDAAGLSRQVRRP